MRIKPVVAVVCLALAAGAAWRSRDAIAPRQSLFDAPRAPTPSEAGLHKCLVAGRVLYTNAGCPRGGREQALTAGSVSVVAAPNGVPPSGTGASGVPNVRELLTDKDAVDIREKQTDAIIGK
jgi:hypothetical protein